MGKSLTFSGVVLIVISTLVIIISSVGAGTVTVDENIIFDSEVAGTDIPFHLAEDYSVGFSVYVEESVDCSDVSVVIYDDVWDYFTKDCDDFMDEPGWAYVGTTAEMNAGDYFVETSHRIIIVDDAGLVLAGLGIIGGGAICVLGLVLLIVGVSTGSKASNAGVIVIQDPSIHPQAGVVTQQPGIVYQQQPVQQYAQPVQQVQHVQIPQPVIHQEIPQQTDPSWFDETKQ